MNKGGRPSAYKRDVANIILARLAEGQSLKSICNDKGLPSMSTVFKWMSEDTDGFSEKYARAKREGAEAWAEEILDISDDATNDWMENNKPDDPGWKFNGEAVQRSRLRVDSRKWLLSKLIPKKYGEKLDVEHSGEVKVSLWEKTRKK